jgi:hypothetical protein
MFNYVQNYTWGANGLVVTGLLIFFALMLMVLGSNPSFSIFFFFFKNYTFIIQITNLTDFLVHSLPNNNKVDKKNIKIYNKTSLLFNIITKFIIKWLIYFYLFCKIIYNFNMSTVLYLIVLTPNKIGQLLRK